VRDCPQAGGNSVGQKQHSIGVRRQKNLSLADFGTADIAQFWLLYTVNSHLPEFNHLFERDMAIRSGCIRPCCRWRDA
jgi:predicted component of type VI protein secretion system